MYHFIATLILSIMASSLHCKTWDIAPGEEVDWAVVKDGDVLCLSGTYNLSIVIKKNIILDGNCYSEAMAMLDGAVAPSWVAAGDVWKTVEEFPLDNSRYASWVLLNDKLISLADADVYRKGNYFYSTVKPLNIKIPKYYSAIIADGNKGLVIKNINISYYHTHGVRISNSDGTIIDNVHVSWVGGGINPKGFPKAGDGITFDGNTSNATVVNSSVYQCFDTGFTMQLFKDISQQAKRLRFIDIEVDRCGAGISVAVHKDNGSTIDDVDIVGMFTNLGYGWSGYDNSVHGRGVMIKQYQGTIITNIKLHDSVIDRFAWVGVLQYSGELDAWNNVIRNGTGEYIWDRYVRPAAYTAHGMDYTRGPSDDEAIGLIINNKIYNNKQYAFQVIHNRPRDTSRKLIIKNNHVYGNDDIINMRTSSNALH